MGQNPKMKLQLYRYNGTRLYTAIPYMYANYPITTTTISITQASTTQNTKYGVYSYLLYRQEPILFRETYNRIIKFVSH